MAYEFSDNIQRAILYYLKGSKDFYHQIVNLVDPDYFEFPSHAKIFCAVRDYFEEYGKLPNDDFILQDLKKALGARESISEYEDELDLINNLDERTTDNPEYILDQVELFAKNEAMKQAISDSILLVKEDRVEEIESVVKKALLISRDVDTGQNYFGDFSQRWDRTFNKEKSDKYRTVLPALDKSLEGGLGKKELAMVIAPPGVGKSLYLVNQGVQSMIEGRKVLYLSLEMSEDKIAQRFDSVMTLVPQFKLKKESTALTVKERLGMFQDEFPGSDLRIKEFPTGTASANTLRNLLVQMKNYDDFEPDLVIIDYLELLRPTRNIEAEYQAQQRVAEEVRGVAMEHNILIWTATQTNRQGRMVKVITDAELGDSYGKIRTCDFAISLNQSEEEFDNGTMRGFVVKSRNGRPRFLVPMRVDYGTLRMSEGEELFDNE